MGKLQDLTGKKYGRLTVQSRHPLNDKRNKPQWNCLCECGNTTVVIGASLRDGLTKSCGCYSKEVARKQGARMFTVHGESGSHEYKVWISMRRRVREPNKKTYESIFVCKEWDESFKAFLADMGHAPSKLHQIDRIDNSKGYFPDNCRWATRKENCRNKTNNVKIEWNGETRCLYEWAEILCPTLGITPDALWSRIKSGWTIHKAFTTKKLRNQFSSPT